MVICSWLFFKCLSSCFCDLIYRRPSGDAEEDLKCHLAPIHGKMEQYLTASLSKIKEDNRDKLAEIKHLEAGIAKKTNEIQVLVKHLQVSIVLLLQNLWHKLSTSIMSRSFDVQEVYVKFPENYQNCLLAKIVDQIPHTACEPWLVICTTSV